MHTAHFSLFDSFCKVIPGGVNSPVRACLSVGLEPVIPEKGEGSSIVGTDGRQYIDFCNSWGALIHGHCHPEIVKAATSQIALGSSFGMPTRVEGEIAEKIVSLVPSIEKIRFVSSGTEATMSAVRLARGYTGRETIIKFNGNYHGHADPFLVSAGSGVGFLPQSSSSGVPSDTVRHTISLPYNRIDLFKEAMNSFNVACVIVEPVAANMGVVVPKIEFLKALREETAKKGAVLIFDEVITGFRLGLQGAQRVFGITPDLTCFGKIVGGGFPAAAFGGKREIMDFLAPIGPVYQAGTLSGNPVAMHAGLKAISLLENPGFFEELERKTLIITKPVQEWIEKNNANCTMQQIGSLFTLFFGQKRVENFEDAKKCDEALFAHLYRHMRQSGVLIPPSTFEAWFVSSAHTDEELKHTRDAIVEFLEKNL